MTYFVKVVKSIDDDIDKVDIFQANYFRDSG